MIFLIHSVVLSHNDMGDFDHRTPMFENLKSLTSQRKLGRCLQLLVGINSLFPKNLGDLRL